MYDIPDILHIAYQTHTNYILQNIITFSVYNEHSPHLIHLLRKQQII